MNLYLHIGTEKTGSSHLQSLSAINRDLLKKSGIWFPEAEKRDNMLLTGDISAGNAQNITDNLNTENFDNCKQILSKHSTEAKSNNCDSLFLSNELLMIAFSEAKRLKAFKNLCQQCGFSHVEYLLILRDPIEQALSLYKHRSKSGIVENIESWTQKHYHYGLAILNFLSLAKVEGIKLTCRKFSYQKNSLENILFKDFLGMNQQLTKPQKTVNPSLTLSELMLLKNVKHKRPYLVEILFERLIKINKENKAESSQIEKYHKGIISDYLSQYQSTWELCNQYLPIDEKISCPKKVSEKQLNNNLIYSFSEHQLSVISGVIADSLSIKFKLKLEVLKLRRQVSKWFH